MSEILLCNRSFGAEQLQSQCGLDARQLLTSSCVRPATIEAHRPYLVAQEITGNRGVMNLLSSLPVAGPLTELCLCYGEDNVVALAGMTETLRSYGVGAVGASTAVYARRVGGFVGAVEQYQAALLAYREAVHTRASDAPEAKRRAHVAFEHMQREFQHELRITAGRVKSRRGTALTSAERGINIARSSRDIARLHVAGQVEATWLVSLVRHAKLLGNGIAAIDFGGRIGSVHNAYRENSGAHKQLFIESLSFVGATLASSTAVRLGGHTLKMLIVVTPTGWIGLLVGGAVVAGVAAGAAVWADGRVKENAGDWYDSLLEKLEH